MRTYIYYDIGGGNHKSRDDVAIIKASSRKQALEILEKYLTTFDEKKLYQLKLKGNSALWISEY